MIQTYIGVWNEGIIRYRFNDRHADIILNIPLVPSLLEDLVVCHYFKDGQFSVKSAYHSGMACGELKEDRRVGSWRGRRRVEGSSEG